MTPDESAKKLGPYVPVLQLGALITAFMFVGIFGLRFIEGAPWVDCFYMTVITVSTVGYEDRIGLSSAGRIFISLYLMGTLGVFTYRLFQIGQLIVGAELRRLRERRLMKTAIGQLKDHFIICGQGQMGLDICRYLAGRKQPFVVIEVDASLLDRHAVPGRWLYIAGDATDDEVLRAAGVKRAPVSGDCPSHRRDIGLRRKGVTVIAIRRPGGERLMLPPDDMVLQAGDCLIAFGTAEAINAVVVDRLA